MQQLNLLKIVPKGSEPEDIPGLPCVREMSGKNNFLQVREFWKKM